VDGLISAVLDEVFRDSALLEKARCAGLLGAMVQDLRPLGYQPADARYESLMDIVLGVFDRQQAKIVPFKFRLDAAEALGQAGDPRLTGENWVRIEGGTFRKGKRQVRVKAFEIGRYPVTVAEFRRFVEDGGYQDERWWAAGGFGVHSEPRKWEEQMEHPNWPVTQVTWYAAKAYCAWAGVRLPSEAEWEWAAGGKEGREYPWGKEKPDATRANCRETGPIHATPVGLYPAGATPEGIEDIAGNVWEWVEDAAEGGKLRVLRGGSWYFVESDLRSGARVRYVPDYWDDDIGFRVSREVSFP
jgi:formylglycine-generating enzyme required for sulfatase activity